MNNDLKLKNLLCFIFLLISCDVRAGVIYKTGALDFTTTGQSMWGSGEAIQFNDSIFVGTQWTDKSIGFGGIIGSVNQTDIHTNPLWWAWRACKDTINFLCGGEPVKGTIKSVIDTRTGARVDLTTSGKFGLELGYTIDSGSVDANAEFLASAVLPSVNPDKFEFFNINPESLLNDGEIISQSPKAEAYISAIAELSGSVNAKACLVLSGCKSGTTNIPTIAVDQKLLVIDPNSLKILPDLPAPIPNPLAEIAILNQEISLAGTLTPIITPPYILPGFKVSTALGTIIDSSPTGTPEVEVDLASIEAQLPDISTRGGLDGDMIVSSGRDDFISAKIDLDGFATMNGMPPAGIGLTLVDLPGFKIGAQFDAIDIDAGPDLGITQDFELDPTLMVRIDFSNPIMIQGITNNTFDFWEGRWDMLPSFALSQTTTFTPTFWLDSMLKNTMGIDLGLSGTMDLFKFGAGVEVAGIDLLSIGPISLNDLLGISNELFSTDKLKIPIWSNPFKLGGFNQVTAASFTIDIYGDSGSINVPEPSGIILLITGFVILLRNNHRKNFDNGNTLIC